MRWLPWERKRVVEPRLPTAEEIDALVIARAQDLAKTLIRDLPREKVVVGVRFADVVPVEGYMVYSGSYSPMGSRYEIHLITDDNDMALACLRVCTQRRMRLLNLWKAPGGALLWRDKAEVTSPTLEEAFRA